MRNSSDPRPRAPLARLARLGGHLVVAALCLELAARIDDRLSYGAPFWGGYDADSLRAPDAEGIPRNVPGARFEKWRINPDGFRGAALPVDRAPGTLRVACLGTSESFGLFEREGGEWPARLDQLLKARRADAEALNASVVGLSRATRQRYVDKYVAPFRPDAIVLYLSVLSDATYRPGAVRPDAAGVGASPWGWLPTSRVLPKLRRVAAGAVPEALHRRYRAWNLARLVRGIAAARLGGRPPADAVPEEAVRAFEAHLRELVAAQRARGIVPVLTTYPTLGSVSGLGRYRVEVLEERIYHVELSERGLIDAAARLNDAVRRVAHELQVPLADPEAALDKTGENFADYVHYTDAGAQRVAEAVLAALERGGLLGPRAGQPIPAAGRVAP